MKKTTLSEARIQANIFQYIWNNYPETRRLFFHIPNGGKRPIVEASHFKAMGVIAGIPDMFLAIPRKDYAGYFIEVKKEGENPTDQQKEIHERLRYAGYKVECFDNDKICIESIINYLY